MIAFRHGPARRPPILEPRAEEPEGNHGKRYSAQHTAFRVTIGESEREGLVKYSVERDAVALMMSWQRGCRGKARNIACRLGRLQA